MQPREHAGLLEARRHTGSAAGERFAGYGVPGLAFESGDVLAFYRCTASTLGPPFLSVWHRDRDARWTFHANIAAQRSWSRYFGPAAGEVRSDDIALRWTGPDAVVVTARRARLQLAVRLDASAAGALLGLAGRLLPERALASRRMARAAAAGAAVLGGGAFALSGSTPSGNRFMLRPRHVWKVAGAACVIAGRDAGSMEAMNSPIGLADFTLSATPIFVTGAAVFHPLHATPHAADVTLPAPGRDALLSELIRQARITSGNSADVTVEGDFGLTTDGAGPGHGA